MLKEKELIEAHTRSLCMVGKDEQLKWYCKRLRMLEHAMDTLGAKETQVIQYRYIDKLPWSKVCEKMFYSRAGANKVHDRAIEKMSIVLFGNKELYEKVKVQ